MNHKSLARLAGILFIVATITFMLGSGLVSSALGSENHLENVSANKNLLIAGVFIQLINSFAVVGIALALYPILKKVSHNLAIGYTVFRALEAVILIVGVIGYLWILPLTSLSAGPESLELVAITGVNFAEYAYQVAMFVLGVYSIYFAYMLTKSQLVPKWIGLLGLVGYVSLVLSVITALLGFDFSMYFYIPGGLFELIFPIWLIIKGVQS